jgi:hypothetical protein
MKPTKAINEWSCALACIEATLAKYDNPITQREIVKAYTPFFSAWRKNQEGLLTRAEIPYLLELLGYHFRLILFTGDKDEFLAIFTKYHNQQRYWASFLIVHQPTNHCYAIKQLDAKCIEAMEPDQTNPVFVPMTFEDIHQNRSPEYILLCS